MKRTIILIACLFAFTCLTASAQQANNWKQRIQTERIAYLTAAVDFTPEEAQLFWPVYNQYWKEYRTAHKQTAKAFEKLQEDECCLSEKEYDSLTEAYLDALKKEQNVIISYYPKFKEVLPANKVARFFVADENFRQQTLRKLCTPKPQSSERDRNR